jgi:hypothetical protein
LIGHLEQVMVDHCKVSASRKTLGHHEEMIGWGILVSTPPEDGYDHSKKLMTEAMKGRVNI